MKINKLVRDKIPQLLESKGKKYEFIELDDAEYIVNLNQKLTEELEEYLLSSNIEELADLVEVILAILSYRDINISEFETIRLKKLAERGGFTDRIFLTEII